MPSFALAAIGRDRPGIVAAVAKVLYEQGCNVEDSSMTLLRGNFSMMLVVAAPEGTTASALGAALAPAGKDMGLTYAVLDVEDTADVPHPSHALTVYGADKPGILYRVTEVLAQAGVNITDVNSRLVGADTPVYALLLELAVPAGLAIGDLERRLTQTAAEIGVDIALNVREDDIL
jgi:glycine cleavage system transcriptional repressor